MSLLLWSRSATIAACALFCFAFAPSAGSAQPEDERDAPGQTIYKRKGPGGREVYTNVEEAVPVEERESSRVELGGTALNTEVADGMIEHSEEEQDRMRMQGALSGEVDHCAGLQRLAKRTTLTRLWQDDPMLLIGAGVLLLVVMFLPAMMRKLAIPGLFRVIFPIVVLAVGIQYGMERSNKSAAELSAKLAPCLKTKLGRLKDGTALDAPSLSPLVAKPSNAQAPNDAPSTGPSGTRAMQEKFENDLKSIQTQSLDHAREAIDRERGAF